MNPDTCLDLFKYHHAELTLAHTETSFLFRLYRFDVFQIKYKKPQEKGMKGYLIASSDGSENMVIQCYFFAPNVVANIKVYRGFDLDEQMGFYIYKLFEQRFLSEKFTLLRPKKFRYE